MRSAYRLSFVFRGRRGRALASLLALLLVAGDLLPGVPAAGTIAARPTFAVAPVQLAAGLDFSTAPVTLAAGDTRAVALGDVDRDGTLDLVVGTRDATRIYRNSGTVPAFGDLLVTLNTGFTHAVALGDVDGDGVLDLVAGSTGVTRIYRNSGSEIPFRDPLVTLPTGNTQSLALGDVDGDGRLDLVVGSYDNGDTRVYRNSGTATLFGDPPVTLTTGDTLSVALGDLNGDGVLDLVVASFDVLADDIRIYLNSGTTIPFGDPPLTLNAGSANAVALGDVDGDTRLDLAVGTGIGTKVYQNSGSAPFFVTPMVTLNTSNTQSVTFGDVDGDGALDLVAGIVNRASIYRNSGAAPRFSDPAIELDSINAQAVALGDLDGDSVLDLVVGTTGGPRIYHNSGAATLFRDRLVTISKEFTNAEALGDVDGDGRLDLVVASFGDIQIYRNSVNALPFSELLMTIPITNTTAVALGDLDGDGRLDLVVGSYSDNLHVYRNNGSTPPFDAALVTITSDNINSVVLGDIDGDGALDLVVGTQGSGTTVYRNSGAAIPFGEPLVTLDTSSTSSVALGDVDSDGALDLVVGTWFIPGFQSGRTQVYRNSGTAIPFGDPLVTIPSDRTDAVALGDVDGDGRIDLVIGANGDAQVYRNSGTAIPFGDPLMTLLVDSTTSVALGDVDGDGRLDLVVGTINSARFYRNSGIASLFGAPSVVLATESTPITSSSTMVTLGDVNGDGALDLVVGTSANAQVYQNRLMSGARILNEPPSIAVTRPGASFPGGTNNAGFFSAGRIISATGVISVPYTLFDREGDPAAVRASYSFDGGGSWRPARAAAGTPTSNLPASPAGSSYIFAWDTFAGGDPASGVFGQSDNLVFRIQAISGGINRNSTAGPYQRPAISSTTFPFRVRGTQARVIAPAALPPVAAAPALARRIFLPLQAADGIPAAGVATPTPPAGAIVYRLPRGQTRDAQAFADQAGRPWHTDARGYLPGHGAMAPGDRLVALFEAGHTDKYTLYYTSAAPSATGVNADTVAGPGVQTLTIARSNPLILFNLSVSLEWDAHSDVQYLSQLHADLLRASELLYDWTDGQIALGTITIYHDKAEWDSADIRVYASNRLRPNAAQGGITPADRADPANPATIYEPGHVQIGATWNRFGDAGQAFAEDWPRALAHELGHYALFLDEDYLGLNSQGLIAPLDGCPSPMSDPYRDDYSEFHPQAGWLPACADTLSNRNTNRSDWATIKAFYDQANLPFSLNQPASFGANPGPSTLPLAVTQLRFVAPSTPSPTLAVPFFGLSAAGARYQAGPDARAFLFRQAGDRLIDLGQATADQVLTRGARPGDRLCVFELSAAHLGCENIQPGDNELSLASIPSWRPEVLITPVTSRTLTIAVPAAGVGAPAPTALQARLFPTDSGTAPINTTLALTNGIYQGTFSLAPPVLQGYVQIWVDETAPRREIVTDYALGGNPAPPRRPPRRSRRRAPAISSDGQVLLFGDDLNFQPGEFYAIQATTALPSVPTWATAIGQGYRLLASAAAPTLASVSVNISYAEGDVPSGEEQAIKIYFWNGSSWKPLLTALDTDANTASARAEPTPGIYALMTSIDLPLPAAGWNLLFFYPGAAQPVTQALASIDGIYTTVYGYDEADTLDPWKVYDVSVPAWVDDLSMLSYGEGYWINTTQPTTLRVRGGTAGAAMLQSTSGILAAPPATYYGMLQSWPGVPQQAGLPVVAQVNGATCGRGQTRALANGQIVFVVDVAAAGVGDLAGCGVPGQIVRIRIGSFVLPISPDWDNGRPHGL